MKEEKAYWIKVHSGLITDPKHREILGVRVWLFMHMINTADWDTGIVEGWTDASEAEKMDMSLITLRKQRRQLEEDGYVTCKKGFQCQRIIIHKWRDPREVNPKQANIKHSDQNGSPHSIPKEITHCDAKEITLHIDQNLSTSNGEKKDKKQKQPKPSYWGDLVVETSEAFNVSTAVAVKYAEQLTGTATKGVRKDHNCDPPAQLGQVKKFIKWYRGECPNASLPTTAENLDKWWYRFKGKGKKQTRYVDGLTQEQVDQEVAAVIEQHKREMAASEQSDAQAMIDQIMGEG